MRRLQLISFTALCAVIFTACNSSTTYKFPTDTFPLKPRVPAQEDLSAFYSSYNSFAEQNANELAQENDNFLFPVVSAYQSGLAILASAEGKSYQQAAKFLRTDSPDEYPLVQCFNPILIGLNKNTNLKFGSSLWMIWPIPLQKPFVAEIAEKTGTDIIYLGNTGITAQRAMDRWLNRFKPETNIPNPGFEQNEPILNIGVTTLKGKFNFAKITLPQKNSAWVAKSSQLALVAWPIDDETFYPSQDFIKQMLQVKAPEIQVGPDGFGQPFVTDLAQLYKSIDCNQILSGPNDFRNLSIEITPKGDPIGIPFLKQYAELSINVHGEIPFHEKQPIGYAIFDIKSGIPLLVGKHSPK